MMRLRSSKIASLGVLTAVGLLISYVESLFIIPIKVPGVRIGLSNLITIIVMYIFGPIEAFMVLITRVLLSGILFGNGLSLAYSISGAIFSYLLMVGFKRIKAFSIVGISVIGGVAHNIAQLIVAAFIMGNINVLYYLPVLLIFGCIAGFIIGMLSDVIFKRLNRVNK